MPHTSTSPSRTKRPAATVFFASRLSSLDLSLLLEKLTQEVLLALDSSTDAHPQLHIAPLVQTTCALCSTQQKGVFHRGCCIEEVCEGVLQFTDIQDEAHHQQIRAALPWQGGEGNPRRWYVEHTDSLTTYSLAMLAWIVPSLLTKRVVAAGMWMLDHNETSLMPDQVPAILLTVDGFQIAVHTAEQLKEAGNDYYHQRSWSEAANQYSLALDSSPPGDSQKYVYHCNRAACYNQMGEHAQAVRDCTMALTLHQNFFKALYRRAQAYEHLGQHAEALADLEALLQVHPANVQAKQFQDRLKRCEACVSDGGPREGENLGPEPDVELEVEVRRPKRRKNKRSKKHPHFPVSPSPWPRYIEVESHHSSV
eukprot:NODE_1088_length_1666_cov_6.275504_g1021_i0.p1 GENE.NODE_1088_length_1666_cov_6.275504_g1021_i0~~NODE_1088_length_1666_cov_6.275504_g1021_i0.p1  ORF type:complete len:367 (+),score=68.97 NODE_1088_length_1666_cov_6.275504_g1021_i0:215-1315(+)